MPEQDSLGSPAPASFKGRLQLDSFKYNAAPAAESTTQRIGLRRTLSFAWPFTVSSRELDKLPQEVSQQPLITRGTADVIGVASTTGGSGSKRKRASTGYAPPSTYAHLPHLPDAILPNLIVLFVGLNPGVQTARTGHAYAHPSNLFWKLLFSSGITPAALPR
ncbi:hypothetical protein ACCO45_006969 [Purpureocillium lilacinum]|uniref:Uncharacterized protein n=1 Tax=Purpureocillium lilacinum TaxID=33203 RepID=A0ACC4DQZ8_PURLI